ncbi:MAG: hypothetical protein GY944_15255 [bacterium]|nr:hypothetical protein [bacterium]
MSTTVVLEPIVVDGRSQLLMLCKVAAKVRYNGRPALALTLLSPRDEFRVGGHTFFVTTAQQPRVGSPTAGEVGTPCPVCLVQIDSKTRIYRCHHCATTVHHEDETWDEEDRLECAQLISECPNCRNDIEFESTGSWVPQW